MTTLNTSYPSFYNPTMPQTPNIQGNIQGVNPYLQAMANSRYGVPNYLQQNIQQPNYLNPNQTGSPIPDPRQLNQTQQQYVTQMNPQNPQPQTGMPQGLPEHLGTNDEVRQAISGANSLYTATLGNSVTGEKGFIDWINAEVAKQGGGTPPANTPTVPTTTTAPTQITTAPTQTTTTTPTQAPLLSDNQTQQLINALNQPPPTGQSDMVQLPNGQMVSRQTIISALEKNKVQQDLQAKLKAGEITQAQYDHLTNGQTPQQIADALSQITPSANVASAKTPNTPTPASSTTTPSATTTPSDPNSMQAMIDEAVRKQLQGNKRKERVENRIAEMRNGASEIPSAFANYGSGATSQAS